MADAPIASGVPLAFATGYDRSAIPGRCSDVARIEKPVRTSEVVAVLGPMLPDRGKAAKAAGG